MGEGGREGERGKAHRIRKGSPESRKPALIVQLSTDVAANAEERWEGMERESGVSRGKLLHRMDKQQDTAV